MSPSSVSLSTMERAWTEPSPYSISGTAQFTDTGACPGSGSGSGSGSQPEIGGASGARDGDNDETRARLIVVMGVSGTGKSTLGKALAENLGLPFIDGDDLHPAANVAKMSRGEPLEDGDRWPWLERIREWAVECVGVQVRGGAGVGERRRLGVIVACSALKGVYRAALRGGSAVVLDTYFVFLKGEREVLLSRMQSRQGHFMKARMLDSQLETLESPEGEPGVVTVTVEMSTAEQVNTVVRELLS